MPPARPAFTMVELLVAISIIVLLAGLTVAFLPSVREQQRSADGAVQVQRFLSVAQQRARRDQTQRGLRFLVGATIPTQISNFQYLEQPDDYFVQGSSVIPSFVYAGTAGTYVSFAPPAALNVDFYQGFGPPIAGQPNLAAVQPGDYLEVNGGGAVHQIMALIPDPSGLTCSTVQLALVLQTTGAVSVSAYSTQITFTSLSNISLGCYLDLDPGKPNAESVLVTKITNTTVTVVGTGVTPTGHAGVTAYSHTAPFAVQSHGIASFGPGTTYRIIRAPRITGDEQLQLPNNVVVDFATNSMYGNSLPLDANGNLNIMFSPTGAVTTPGLTQGYLALWVRDLNAGPAANGIVEFELSPTIIAVYARTGLIAAHPPAVPSILPASSGFNPYAFLTSGLAQ